MPGMYLPSSRVHSGLATQSASAPKMRVRSCSSGFDPLSQAIAVLCWTRRSSGYTGTNSFSNQDSRSDPEERSGRGEEIR